MILHKSYDTANSVLENFCNTTAIISNRVLLTKNCRDFELLHQRNPKHPGILAIYESSSTSKNMSFQDIVGAISNLEAANISLENQFISLNPWSY